MKPEEINVAKDGGSAFPFQPIDTTRWDERIYQGMSLRDYFAAKAMEGSLSSQTLESHWPMHDEGLAKDSIRGIARLSYDLADAMLEARIGKWVETKGEGE